MGTWTPTATELVDALREHYLPPTAVHAGTDEWSLLTEVSSAGAPLHSQPAPAQGSTLEDLLAHREATTVRSIDVLLQRNWSSGRHGLERLAVEVKISRGDFLRDTDAKRAPWQQLAHRFAYCTPVGLLTSEDIPDGCWLIEISEQPCTHSDGPAHRRHTPTRVHWNAKVKGRRARTVATPVELTVALARRASRAEARLHEGAGQAAASAAAEQLRLVQARLAAAQQRESVVKARTATLMELLAPLGPQVCAECSEPIKPVGDRYGQGRWTHRNTASEASCRAAWHERRLAEQTIPQDPTKAARQSRRVASWYQVEPASIRAERDWAEDVFNTQD